MIKSREQKRKPEGGGKTRAVLRQIAAAFRQVEDFEPFVKGLETALGQAEFFDRAAISLYPRLEEGKDVEAKAREGDGSAGQFPDASLCLPLSDGGPVHGLVNFGGGRHPFGPEDLHLMAGLGDLLGVLVEHALRFGEQRRNLALLGFLLDQAPVGAACFDRDGNLVVSNGLGRRLLGVNGREGEPWVLPEEWAEEARAAAAASGVFHRQIAGQLLHVQAKRASSDFGEEMIALVLADLTPEQVKLQEGLARETYRCGWLGRPISLAVVSAAAPGNLMALLRPLRERFGASALVGPCDSEIIGIVFPETIFPEAMEKIRAVRPFLEDDWSIGVAMGEVGNHEPEALFASAAGARRRVGDVLKHSLLLHDDYPSVNDMLELVLRDDFRVFKSSDLDITMRQLRTGQFDGFISEIDLSKGASAVDLARVAREANPQVRPFFTSCAAISRRQDPRFRQEVVFQKPFEVREVLMSVRQAFA